MDNENSLDQNYTVFKKYLACGSQYRNMEEFINHARDPWHDELKISSYSNYIFERETSKNIKFIEYNKNKLTRGNSYLRTFLGEMMIYKVLIAKPRDAIDHFIKGWIRILLTSLFFIRIINRGTCFADQ